MRTDRSIFYRIDWVIVILYLVLVFLGWINIYASVYDENHNRIIDLTQKYGKQMIWIAAALFLAMVTLLLDPKFFSQFAYLIYGFFLVLALAVVFMGKEVAGSKSWFQVAGIALQPAEFAKMATNLALAKFLSALDTDIRKKRHLFLATLIIAVPAVFILMEHDTGSAIVFTAFILVFFRAGLPSWIMWTLFVIPILSVLALVVNKYILIATLIVPAFFFFISSKRTIRSLLTIIAILVVAGGFVLSVDYGFEKLLKPHQKQRIHVLLGQDTDLKGAGYNVNQSLIAIGSGRVAGKGFLHGTQTKYNFVPEQSTDFIFCTVGEEWGFLGSVVIVILFTVLFSRILLMAERQRSRFARYYGYGVASLLFFHFAVNIGMALGLLPVIGIPLPFFSYGGSSLWAFTILLFIFIRQDSYRYELI
jgi:rod shape determining protein RodA